MAELIAAVSTSSQRVSPGEPVDITVTLNDTSADATVAIAGIRGSTHTLQAPIAPGAWAIPIVAGTPGGEIDRRTTQVTVEASAPAMPRLAVERDPFTPYSVVFSFPGDAFPQGVEFHWLAGPIAAVTTDPVLAVDLSVAVDDAQLFTVIPIDVGVRYPDGTVIRPRRTLTLWSVYQVIRSAGQISPPVSTNGIATRRISEQPGQFQGEFSMRNLEPVELHLTSMQVHWLTPGGDDLSLPGPPEAVDIRIAPSARHTRAVALDRSAAPAESNACLVHFSGAAGDLPAHVEVAFELRSLEPLGIPELPPRYRKPWPGAIEEWGIDVLRRVNPAVLTSDHGLTTHGMWVLDRVAGAAVRAQQEIAPQRQLMRQTRRVRVQDLLGGLRERAFSFRNGAAARRLEPARLDAMRINVPMRTLQDSGIEAGRLLEASAHRLYDRQFDMAFVPGTPCDPDNLPAGVPEGVACQFTGAFEEKMLPARVMNAEKGDILLSPGGSGVIGGLLRQVTPAQRYSHTGICTRNRVEVAHATGSDGWLKAQHSGGVWSPPFGSEAAPSDGFTPAALKYIWPGGVIQTAGEATTGSEFLGPDGKQHRLTCLGQSGFAQFGENWELIPAVIVKPHPLQDTVAVRTRLHQVADAARELCVTADDARAGQQSKLHYRFFCYTDAAIESPAPADSGWAAGTLPAVCSSFIWLAAKRAGVQHFEGGALEADDVRPGVEVEIRPGIPDGLYHYTAAERADAAEWLYQYYQNDVVTTLDEKTGGSAIGAIWETFSDIADDVSNQILNTFAHDWTDTDAKDSERWRDEPRDGAAVSPDDLMRWDSPDQGGLWGTIVAMDYRSSRPERVPMFAWRETMGPGTLVGHVTFRGQPAPGADVKVGGQDLNADAGGTFTVQLFEGPYVVEAGMHVDGIGYVEAKTPVTVLFNQTVDEVITLQEPPDVYRRLVVTGEGMVRDDETFGSDEVEPVGFRREFDVQPFRSHAEWQWSQGVGDEVLVDLVFNVDLQFDRSVSVRIDGSFWESDDEERTDLEMSKTWQWTIPPGQTHVHRISLWNEEEDSPGDNLDVTLTLANELQP